jgi:hypothetical protein
MAGFCDLAGTYTLTHLHTHPPVSQQPYPLLAALRPCVSLSRGHTFVKIFLAFCFSKIRSYLCTDGCRVEQECQRLYHLEVWLHLNCSKTTGYNYLTPWKWILLEKPSVVQLLKNFPTFYGNQKFITVFTIALHWSLSWTRPTYSIPPRPIFPRSILILSNVICYSMMNLGLCFIVS